jgi:hypothetical protein
MANLSKTKTLFSFTSPRTIEKIIPEIKLLTDIFSNQLWNGKNQSAFYDELFKSDFFEGETKVQDTELAARDRITRAPKALGFIDLKPTIQLTPAGKRLISEKRIYETITRQLLKFQLPSLYHTDSQNRFFCKTLFRVIKISKSRWWNL